MLIRLQSERLAVLVEQSAELLLVVKVFYSTHTWAALPVELIDLSKLKGRERITGRESPEKWGFRNLDALWSGLDRQYGSLFDPVRPLISVCWLIIGSGADSRGYRSSLTLGPARDRTGSPACSSWMWFSQDRPHRTTPNPSRLPKACYPEIGRHRLSP